MVPWEELSPEDRLRYGESITGKDPYYTMSDADAKAHYEQNGGQVPANAPEMSLSYPPAASGSTSQTQSPSQAVHQDEYYPAPTGQMAPPPVSAPPPVGAPAAAAPSSSYTSGGGSGGSYQATPSGPAAPQKPAGSEWSAALHASGALQDPRANPIPFGSAPGANTGAFDPYMRNTQGAAAPQAGAPMPQAGGGVPPISPPPMAGMSTGMTNFNPQAQPVGPAQGNPMGGTVGSPSAPMPQPSNVQPPVAPQGMAMSPEEMQLQLAKMNQGMASKYGQY